MHPHDDLCDCPFCDAQYPFAGDDPEGGEFEDDRCPSCGGDHPSHIGCDGFPLGEDDDYPDPPDLDESDAVCTCGDPECNRPFGHD